MATAKKKPARKSPATKVSAATRLIKSAKASIQKAATMLAGVKPAVSTATKKRKKTATKKRKKTAKKK